MGPQVGRLVLLAAIIARRAIPFAPEILRAAAANIISAMVVLSPSNQRGEPGPVLLRELAQRALLGEEERSGPSPTLPATTTPAALA
jgi:hypothetical protein